MEVGGDMRWKEGGGIREAKCRERGHEASGATEVRSDLERNVADTEARLKNDIRQKQQEALLWPPAATFAPVAVTSARISS